MKTSARYFLIVSTVLLLGSAYSYAEFSNSTSYKTFLAIDEAGGRTNSSNFVVEMEANEALGISAGTSSKVCLGNICVEFGPLGEIIKVTFVFQANINGSAGDVGYADSNTTLGLYKPSDLQRYYGCIDDPTVSGNPVFGNVFAGSRFSYIRLDNSGEFSLRLQQEQPGNKFVLPVTTGGCTVVQSRVPLGQPIQPFVPFANLINAIELVIGYPIDLIGNFEGSGRFTLILEKNESSKIIGEVA